MTPVDLFEDEKYRASGAKDFAALGDDMHRAFIGFVKFMIPERRRNDALRRLKRHGFDFVMYVSPSDPDSRAPSKASRTIVNHYVLRRCET